jgi:hypothetical protein
MKQKQLIFVIIVKRMVIQKIDVSKSKEKMQHQIIQKVDPQKMLHSYVMIHVYNSMWC